MLHTTTAKNCKYTSNTCQLVMEAEKPMLALLQGVNNFSIQQFTLFLLDNLSGSAIVAFRRGSHSFAIWLQSLPSKMRIIEPTHEKLTHPLFCETVVLFLSSCCILREGQQYLHEALFKRQVDIHETLAINTKQYSASLILPNSRERATAVTCHLI